MAKSLRLEVAWDNRQRGRARLVTRVRSEHSSGTILLRPDPRPERRQWAVAHEIGEHLAADLFQRAGLDDWEIRPRMREEAANSIAARLLIPRRWFASDAARLDWDLLALKTRYSTASHELIARRMLDFELPIVITIFDQGQLTFRRASLARRVPLVSTEEAKAQQGAHQSSEAVVHRGQATVQAWPIHEPHWKREILRTRFPEEELD